MGRRKKIIETELEADQNLLKKDKIIQLTGKYFNNFSGDTYNHSIQLAYEWEALRATDKEKPPIKLRDYYAQTAFGKSIIVSYDVIKEK